MLAPLCLCAHRGGASPSGGGSGGGAGSAAPRAARHSLAAWRAEMASPARRAPSSGRRPSRPALGSDISPRTYHCACTCTCKDIANITCEGNLNKKDTHGHKHACSKYNIQGIRQYLGMFMCEEHTASRYVWRVLRGNAPHAAFARPARPPRRQGRTCKSAERHQQKYHEICRAGMAHKAVANPERSVPRGMFALVRLRLPCRGCQMHCPCF